MSNSNSAINRGSNRMYSYQNVIGNENVIEHLRKSKKNNKVAHAYIIVGPEGSGKKTIAYSFAKALQCENSPDSACHKCESCIQLETKNNPDVKKLYQEKETSISVKEIRSQINNDILIKPYSYKHKIYIIEDADKMTPGAQNALLKTLEEPPSYAVIFLLVNNVDHLLSTIKSRCISINTRAISKQSIKEYLMKYTQLPDYKAKLCADFSNGLLGIALKLVKSDEFIQMKDNCIKILTRIKEFEIVDIIEYLKTVNEYKNKINDYLDLIIMWYRDVLLVKSGISTDLLVFCEEEALLIRDANRLTYHNLKSNIDTVEATKSTIESNVNQELALELMFTKIKENI